jgi:hypothetical protein
MNMWQPFLINIASQGWPENVVHRKVKYYHLPERKMLKFYVHYWTLYTRVYNLLQGAKSFLKNRQVLSMEPKGSLPHSQESATCPCLQPDSKHCPQPTSWRSSLILFSHLRLGVPSGLFPSRFPTKTLCDLARPPHVLHASPLWIFLL